MWFAHDRIDPPRVDMAHFNQEAIEELFFFSCPGALFETVIESEKTQQREANSGGVLCRLINVIVHPERKHE